MKFRLIVDPKFIIEAESVAHAHQKLAGYFEAMSAEEWAKRMGGSTWLRVEPVEAMLTRQEDDG